MKLNYKTLTAIILCFTASLVTPGCKKFLEVGTPYTNINSDNVYNNNTTAISVLTGIYTSISNANSAGLATTNSITGISLYCGVSADELTLFSQNAQFLPDFYKNNLTKNTGGGQFWLGIYPTIYICNVAIEGLTNSTGLSTTVKQQLLGEAKFIRAYCYFNLTSLYGDVPIATGTDYKANSTISRSSQPAVYQQIIQDLKDAQQLLSSNYVDVTLANPSTERTRPNKWAATALLARVYFFMGDFADAKNEATAVINNPLFSLNNLQDVFLKNSKETIWSIQPTGTGQKANTGEGALFILPATGPSAANPVYLSSNLINSFEPGDQRFTKWTNKVVANNITYYYPYKYKIGKTNTATSEYIMVLRSAEQYLIRAEAEANTLDFNGAVSDLNTIRNRAGLPNYSGTIDKAPLLAAILHERQVELFSEWGHRWLDLKRTKNVDAVMSIVTPQKGGTWDSYKALYPVPQAQINLDQQLTQNTGY